MRTFLSVLLLVHGFAHVVGFVGPWHPGENVAYKTTLFAGRIDVGDGGIKIVGLLWMLAALAFAVAGCSAFAGLPWWPSFALLVSLVSLAMCVAGWPDTKVGAAVNAGLVVILLAGTRVAWIVGRG
jgi:hypothetical protein